MTTQAGTPGTDDFPDLATFAAIYFEEAAEHIAGMESMLVGLDPANASDEELNAIFRAAHSIKGGAATFGFQNMADVTHVAESLLDKARKRKLVLTPPMIDALLASLDVLTAMLACHRGEGGEPPSPDGACQRIRESMEGSEPMAPEKPAKPVVGAQEPAAPEPGAEAASAPAPDAPPPMPDDGSCGWFGDPPEVAAAESAPTPEAAAEDKPAPEAARPEPAPSAAPKASAATAAAAAGSPDSMSLRVNVSKVDHLVNQVGELVITQAMLAQQVAVLEPSKFGALIRSMRELERNTRGLQESVLSIRMMPIAFVFNRFPRMVRELAGTTRKEVQLRLEGEGTELDKGVIEKLSDPLTHLVRNAIDHGIETPDEREAAGKVRHGTVTLKAMHRGGSIVVEVSDDGKGLDRARLLAKARERGMALADDAPDAQVFAVVFEPGLSTAEKVTEVSGRGVGMDVVRRNILSLGGQVDIDSAPGCGTRVTVNLPLTLAIMDGMSIGIGGETYILPLASVIESLQVPSESLLGVGGAGRVIHVRGEYLPVIALRERFGLEARADADDILVVVEGDGGKAALLVDALLGQHQVVVKNLQSNYRKVANTSGATILGDGTVALILDVPALVKCAARA